MSDNDFLTLSEFIQTNVGIKMPGTKKIMLEARLRKRLRKLGMETFREYCDYVFSPEGKKEELTQMINVITTNKTDFFREPAHFDYLTSTALPELINMYGLGIKKKLILWSALAGRINWCRGHHRPDLFSSVRHLGQGHGQRRLCGRVRG